MLCKKLVYSDMYKETKKKTTVLYDLFSKDLTPTIDNIFKPLRLTGPYDVKCVILGVGPSTGAANINDGLAGSVAPRKRQKFYASLSGKLRNIYLFDQVPLVPPLFFNLEDWATRGVLCWNTRPISSTNAELFALIAETRWWRITCYIINRLLNETHKPIYFIVLGDSNRWVRDLLFQGEETFTNQYDVTHKMIYLPSCQVSVDPLSYEDLTSKPFSKCNVFLGPKRKIDWSLK